MAWIAGSPDPCPAASLIVSGLRSFLHDRRGADWRTSLTAAGLPAPAMSAFRRLIELHEAFGLLQARTGPDQSLYGAALTPPEAALLLALRLIQRDMPDDAAAVFRLNLPAAAARLAQSAADVLARALAGEALMIAPPVTGDAAVTAGPRVSLPDPGLQRLQ
jgi:hypothetical protein